MEKKNKEVSKREKVDELIRRTRSNVSRNDLQFSAHEKINKLNNHQLVDFIKKPNDIAFVDMQTILREKAFIVRQNFQHNKKSETGVQLYIYDDFENNLLALTGDNRVKLAKNCKLRKIRLLRDFNSDEIKKEVGINLIKIDDFFPILWSLLCKQKNGKHGFLDTDSFRSIFCVELKNKKVVIVEVSFIKEWNLGLIDHDLDLAGSCIFIPVGVEFL